MFYAASMASIIIPEHTGTFLHAMECSECMDRNQPVKHNHSSSMYVGTVVHIK